MNIIAILHLSNGLVKREEMSSEEAIALDDPEGAVTIEVGAKFFGDLLKRAGERLA